ncbi:MAG: hemerythrin domain-containing protein [Planctomycetaceae bacterium]|nr:hemerythrin domain-containing protein [Planctomycetales bacterium]MCB9873547.1 hemerythrin domain-containing protein [Planctomycetaceae bacterium]MCB9937107.1 hemerythrin domain-containing protein [Planctomycetaceae bacterium]HRX78197.1 hemerythrin domain-containing protein [Pirellulaceae bacterium]
MATELDTSGKFDPFVDEHEALHFSLRDLRWLLEDRQSPEAVSQGLFEFSEHVKTHFVHEEETEGFFDSVVDQAPHLKSRADALVEEHAAMLQQLAQLARFAQQGDGSNDWWSRMNDEFERFWQTFCRHERSENDLVQEAFHHDIGSKD